MTENKAETLLTDWAMSLVEPEHIPTFYDVNILAAEEIQPVSRHRYKSDIPLYRGGTTLQDYREQIGKLLERSLTRMQLEAAFLFFATPRSTFTMVHKALSCDPKTVSRAVKKATHLVKAELD